MAKELPGKLLAVPPQTADAAQIESDSSIDIFDDPEIVAHRAECLEYLAHYVGQNTWPNNEGGDND